MKTINLTTAASALAYLQSLPDDTSISLPGAYETLPDPGPGDAVAKITGESANAWATSVNRWEWTAAELVKALDDINSPTHTAMGASDYHGKPTVWVTGMKIMHVDDDGNIHSGTVNAIVDEMLALKFPDDSDGWEFPNTCYPA